jgi:putative two-component system response regulator
MMTHDFARVLVADDEPGNVELVRRVVTRLGCDVVDAADGEAALAAVHRERPDIVLLDVNMPRLDGFDVCRSIKDNPDTRLLPVVLITALSAASDRIRAIHAGADAFLSKPFVPGELAARVRSLVQLKHHTDGLDSAEAVVLSLARIIEARDPYTSGHCERLAGYATDLGRWIGLDDQQCRALFRGGFLHDLGKIGIADAILLKPGSLSSAEFAAMQQHTVIGDRLCADLRSLEDVRPIVRHHHERADGSGYPDGLRGDRIPLTAQIIAIVDGFDAMTTDRPYKAALQPHHAFDELRNEVRRGWKDAALVDHFVEMMTARAAMHGEAGHAETN